MANFPIPRGNVCTLDLLNALVGRCEMLMTVAECAEYLGIGKRTLYRMVANEAIPFARLGTKLIRFDKDVIDAWVQAKK